MATEPTITEAEIEAAGEAMWTAEHPRGAWAAASAQRAYYRRNAKIALEAAARVRANANQTGDD